MGFCRVAQRTLVLMGCGRTKHRHMAHGDAGHGGSSAGLVTRQDKKRGGSREPLEALSCRQMTSVASVVSNSQPPHSFSPKEENTMAKPLAAGRIEPLSQPQWPTGLKSGVSVLLSSGKWSRQRAVDKLSTTSNHSHANEDLERALLGPSQARTYETGK